MRTPAWLSESSRPVQRGRRNGRGRTISPDDEPAEIQTWLEHDTAAALDGRCLAEGISRAEGIRRAARAWGDFVLIGIRLPVPALPHPEGGVKVRAATRTLAFSRLALAARVAGVESVAAAARVAIGDWCAGWHVNGR